MQNALEISDLQKTYTNGVQALKGIDLSVKKGDFFALLGANGAGKSTTIGIISHLVQPTRGSVKIFGQDIRKHPFDTKLKVGLVPQEFNCNIFETCQQVLIQQAGYYGTPRKTAKKRAQALLEVLDLQEKAHQIIRHLSGGMKRRLMIARALVHQPQLLILDEPTAGVDVEIRRSMWEFLKHLNAQGTTIILTTHYLEEAEFLCRNLAIIKEGTISANDSMHNILSKLQHQTFILNIENPPSVAPNIEGAQCTRIEANQLEVRIQSQDNLNHLFQQLDAMGLRVLSIRNKSNRLEELFLDLINNEK